MCYDSLGSLDEKFPTIPTEIEEQLCEEERTVRELCCEFLATVLNSLLLPVYTRKDEDDIENYFALPAGSFNSTPMFP